MQTNEENVGVHLAMALGRTQDKVNFWETKASVLVVSYYNHNLSFVKITSSPVTSHLYT